MCAVHIFPKRRVCIFFWFFKFAVKEIGVEAGHAGVWHGGSSAGKSASDTRFRALDWRTLQVLWFLRVKIASKTEILAEEIYGWTGAGFTCPLLNQSGHLFGLAT